MIAVARARYSALKAKLKAEKKRLRDQGRDDSKVNVPKDLANSKAYVQRLKRRLAKKFKKIKQRIR